MKSYLKNLKTKIINFNPNYTVANLINILNEQKRNCKIYVEELIAANMGYEVDCHLITPEITQFNLSGLR